jgi:hypothetical protein
MISRAEMSWVRVSSPVVVGLRTGVLGAMFSEDESRLRGWWFDLPTRLFKQLTET